MFGWYWKKQILHGHYIPASRTTDKISSVGPHFVSYNSWHFWFGDRIRFTFWNPVSRSFQMSYLLVYPKRNLCLNPCWNPVMAYSKPRFLIRSQTPKKNLGPSIYLSSNGQPKTRYFFSLLFWMFVTTHYLASPLH